MCYNHPVFCKLNFGKKYWNCLPESSSTRRPLRRLFSLLPPSSPPWLRQWPRWPSPPSPLCCPTQVWQTPWKQRESSAGLFVFMWAFHVNHHWSFHKEVGNLASFTVTRFDAYGNLEPVSCPPSSNREYPCASYRVRVLFLNVFQSGLWAKWVGIKI